MPISDDVWRQKQELAKPCRYYGHGGTIHDSQFLDVETDDAGTVVAVWFRCQMLPFLQTSVSASRAAEMRGAYDDTSSVPQLTGVEVLDIDE